MPDRDAYILEVEGIPFHADDPAFRFNAKRLKAQAQFIPQLQFALLVKGQRVVGRVFRNIVGVTDILHIGVVHHINGGGTAHMLTDANRVAIVFDLASHQRDQLHHTGTPCGIVIDTERHLIFKIHCSD